MPAEAELFHNAVNHWWSSKSTVKSKKTQGGTRDVNLHGKTMDGFATTIRDFLVGLGVNPAHIFAGGHLSTTPSILPSYFRPSKNWDLIVLANSRFHPAKGDAVGPVLYAAVEFKSQDKSIGNAHDFWVTYGQSGFERQPKVTMLMAENGSKMSTSASMFLLSFV